MPSDGPHDATDEAGDETAETPDEGEDGDTFATTAANDLLTTNPEVRVVTWSTFAAALILVVFYLLWGYAVFYGVARPGRMDGVAYAGVLLALVWTFGDGTVRAFRRVSEYIPVSFGGRTRN